MDRRNNFLFVRFLLASLVVVSHAPRLKDGARLQDPIGLLFGTMSCGAIALHGFFILSGYLVTQSFLNSTGVLDYLRKRVLRIYPGFLVAFAITVLVATGTAIAGSYHGNMLLDAVTLEKPDIVGAFAGHPFALVNAGTEYGEFNLPMWTIRYEFLCYFMVAALGAFGLLRGKLVLFLGAVATFLYMVAPRLGLGGYDLAAARFSSYFLSGSAIYLLRDRVKFTNRGAWIAGAILFLLMFNYVTANFGQITLGAYLIVGFALADIPALRFYQRIPDVSYGLYLYAWPIQKILYWSFPNIPVWPSGLLTWIIAVAFGYASFKLIEEPFLRLKKRKPVLAPA